MKYTIGLDIGTSSVGWAVIDTDLHRIHDLGVRLFESAEHQKDGSSLAVPRRIARSMRRRLARRGYRLAKIRDIFTNHFALTQEAMQNAHLTYSAQRITPYDLRARALDELISPEELFVAVYHLAKRRGYKSNRKSQDLEVGEGSASNEKKAVLSSIGKNRALLASEGYRTWGECMSKHSAFSFSKRNKSGDYSHAVDRHMLLDELHKILSAQQRFGSTLVTDAVISLLSHPETGAFSYQRHYAKGDQIKQMIGKCEFETDELRGAKATYSFQLFNILQRVNHIRIDNPNTGERPLLPEERQAVLDFAKSHPSVDYGQLRKKLGLDDTDRFNMVRYAMKRKKAKAGDVTSDEHVSMEQIRDTCEKDTKFPAFKAVLEIIKRLEAHDGVYAETVKNSPELLDIFGEVLTLYKTDEDITEQLKFRIPTIPDGAIAQLLSLDYSPTEGGAKSGAVSYRGVGHLSIKALRKIIPFLMDGKRYDESAKLAGYAEKVRSRELKLKPIPADDHTITNPVARRAISQTIKVVNAIVDRYGSPDEVHIELARELAKNWADRKKMGASQDENKVKNAKAEERLKELYPESSPRGHDIVKFKLWKEQGGKCLYSGATIDEQRLFDDGYVEVDHIVPFSRSFDDSYANKALVMTQENQRKMNRTPFEYLGGDEVAWSAFEARVTAMLHGIGFRKRDNLMRKKVVVDALTTRTLNDTRYITRYMKNYIDNGLLFREGTPKQRVVTVNGQATAYLRKRWHLSKDRAENHRHHAQDAVLVAVTDQSLVQRVMNYAKVGEIATYLAQQKFVTGLDPETSMPFDDATIERARLWISAHDNRSREHFPPPWVGFSDEVEARMTDDPVERIQAMKSTIHGYKTASDFSHIRPIFVSRMPRRAITGRAHQETLRSPKRLDKEESSVRMDLKKVHLKNLEDMAGKERDPLLYGAVKQRLQAFGDDPEKAFSEPLYKPFKDGTMGAPVRSIRMISSGQKSGILVNHGKAVVDQDSMIRIDIFSRPNKKGKDEYYICPVYAYHFAQGKLPNKVITAKSEKDWEEIDESFTFEFALYPNDLVRIVKGNDKDLFGYYSGCDRANAQIHITSHDQLQPIRSQGIKTLDKINKYVVDILGFTHPVGRETRQEIVRNKKTSTPAKP